MNEELISQREQKKIRTQFIIELIKNYPIRSQDEIAHYLKENYGIETNQSTISRDIASLGLVKNHETNCYQLGEDAKKEEEKQELINALEHGGAFISTTNMSMFTFKVTPTHAPLIAEKLESYFSNDENFIGSLVGPTGTIALLVSKKDEKRVQAEIDSMFP